MSLGKREEVKRNLLIIKHYLSKYNQDDNKQNLMTVLENPDALIPENFEGSAFSQTKTILQTILSKDANGLNPEQAKLNRLLIRACMEQVLLETPVRESNLFTKPSQDLASPIANFVDHPITHAARSSTALYGFFQPVANLQTLFHAVVWSDADGKVAGEIVKHKVKDILSKNPALLFEKGQYTKHGIRSKTKTLAKLKRDEFEELASLIMDKSLLQEATPDNYQDIIFTEEQRLQLKAALSNAITDTEDNTMRQRYHHLLSKLVDELYEQTYYDVSPFQLILFFGDIYLLNQIEPFITDEFLEKAVSQANELQGGGSDLVKITPREIKESHGRTKIKSIHDLSYEELTRVIVKDAHGKPKTYLDEHGVEQQLTFSLQENKDAIVAYGDEYYWVCLNQDTKKIEKIEPITFHAEDEQLKAKEMAELKSFFDDIEPDSGRRSNHKQHAFIFEHAKSESNPNGINLEQRGVRYKRDGEYFTDCKAEFFLEMGLRKFIRKSVPIMQRFIDPNTPTSEKDLAKKEYEAAWIEDGEMKGFSPAATLLLLLMKHMTFVSDVPYPNIGPFYPHHSSVPDFEKALTTQGSPSADHSERQFKMRYRADDSQLNDNSTNAEDYVYANDAALVIGVDCSISKNNSASSELGIAANETLPKIAFLDLLGICRYDEMSRDAVNEFTEMLNARYQCSLNLS